MNRIIAWALAALLLGSGACAATPEPKSNEEEIALLKDSFKNYQAKNWALAVEQIKVASDSPLFENVTEDGRLLAMRVLTDAAYQAKDYAASFQAARQACQFLNANGNDWYIRIWAAYHVKDNADMIASFTVLAERWPQQLTLFRFEFFRFIYRSADELRSAEQVKTDLSRALLKASWSPSDEPAQRADWIWFDLAHHDLLEGNPDEGAKAVARVTGSYYLRRLWTETIFDPVTSADPDRFDDEKVVKRELEQDRQRVKTHPELLEAVLNTAEDLLGLDRPDEALALLDEAKGKSPTVFTDADDQLNWLDDMRARALLALGRRDEAIAALEAGAAKTENGGSNISQIINLAESYNNAGRSKEAAAILTRLDPARASPFGRMQYEVERACAAAELKDAAGLKTSLDYLTAHGDDAPNAVLRALLWTGDIDGAARFVVAQLAKPDKRTAMIAELQVYAYPKRMTLTAQERRLKDSMAQLRARADVKRALEPYGRILKFKIVQVE